MPSNTAWDTGKSWGRWRPGRAPDGSPSVWTGRSIVAGAAALYVGLMLAFEVYAFAGLTMETYRPPDGPGGGLLMLPFSLCFGVPAALWGSLAIVLPLVWAARRAGARLTGRDAWWWVPAVAAVPAALITAVVAVALHPRPGPLGLTCLSGEVLLAGPALLARYAVLDGRRLLLSVLGCGALAAAVVFGIGATAFGTGLLAEYRPPKVDAAGLAGAWADGHNGTLRLNADGTARAEGLTDHESAYEDHADAHRDLDAPGAYTLTR